MKHIPNCSSVGHFQLLYFQQTWPQPIQHGEGTVYMSIEEQSVQQNETPHTMQLQWSFAVYFIALKLYNTKL
jgi:hypothetical protein